MHMVYTIHIYTYGTTIRTCIVQPYVHGINTLYYMCINTNTLVKYVYQHNLSSLQFVVCSYIITGKAD